MKKATQCALVGAAILFQLGCGEWSSIETTKAPNQTTQAGPSRDDEIPSNFPSTQKNDPSAKVLIAQMAEVLDGDTIHVEDEYGNRFTIRLDGIDAPESNQAYGLDARMELRRLVLNRPHHIEWKARDRYQRILGPDLYG